MPTIQVKPLNVQECTIEVCGALNSAPHAWNIASRSLIKIHVFVPDKSRNRGISSFIKPIISVIPLNTFAKSCNPTFMLQVITGAESLYPRSTIVQQSSLACTLSHRCLQSGKTL